MSCDIHTIWQKSTPQGWVDIPHEYNEARDYRLFTILAGVRSRDDIPERQISDPRGLPYDFEMSGIDEGHKTTVECVPIDQQEYFDGMQWMGDHSHSFFSSWELIAWVRDNQELARKYKFFDEVYRLHDLHGEIRIVFGFDN